MAKPINLDERIVDDEEIPTTQIVLFGQEWTIPCSVNSFTLSGISMGDAGAVSRFLVNSVIPEQQSAFADALSRQPNLTADKLLTIINGLIEVASERPTKSPSVSSRPATKRTSAPKSTARSSSAARR